MAEHKYRFNPNTLNFERIRTSGWKKLKRISLALAPGLLIGVIGIFLAFQFIDSPKEATLRRENQQLQVEYELINKQLADMEDVLSDIERRDDNVYRVIFEADPIPSTVRMAGIGGVNRYKDLSGFANSELVIGTRKRLDMIAKRMYVQSLSLDEVGSLVLRKQEMLASIPSVEPIPQDQTRVSSGFGERMHPIYKIEKPHMGLDFTSPIGTEIHATGDGTVDFAGYNTTGFGIHVIIDHGFGYQTLYGHMSELKVRAGQKVKRGDVIGEVGSTGLSTGPHLHYEVHKDGMPVDPVNFLFNSLSPEEYARMVEIAGNAGQSMD
ncbi:MAG: M23 family metallopeptidase [Flavobacteriales bacterium]|jgi:murein DD-endopeptidase MepM/ murein hydrolase activator NlpD|nr:M23 family metallopeptidase [Flavobacteriales bacterium]MBK6893266.1 M23 family metallopeptidase [Flavobacteriales bacterium]MBK7249004.1 M23 family metallopeptidase [Flavobacteriales bacterium]MBK7288517.1 M23 family metallopeptidase [Flavobacteriales bacterium]MBK9599960.1 M23 family metallopeptidase [Flavobacteriales bacterium]